MKRACSLVCISGVLASCVGDPQFVLHRPVMDRCVAAGLTDCRRLTHATLLYADGKPVDGRRQLLAGLDENRGRARELVKFALDLEQVSATSGGGMFQAPIQPVVYQVRQVAAHGTQEPTDPACAVPTKRVAPGGPSLLVSSHQPVLPPSVSPPSSVFFMLAGNALAGDCRFPSAPTMRCLHEDVETLRIVTDISVSPACPYDVLFASRRGIELDWATYAPAGKGAEVHGAQLPLIPGRTLTAGVSFINDDAPPDVRCGITVVWRDVADATALVRPREAKGVTMAPQRQR